jgi:peptidoglycan biosynthesis protein MviN/MurJ (putative lipid II flippase)
MLTALEGLDHPKLAFQSNLALIISNILLNISLIYFFGWVGAAVATTLSVCISFLLGYWHLNKIINITIPIHMIGKELIAAGIMGSTVQLLLHIQNIKLVALNNITVVLLVISLGAGTYFTTLGIISSEFRKIISDNISIY